MAVLFVAKDDPVNEIGKALCPETGINRGTLTRLYYETAERVEIDVLDKLCDYFGIDLPELLERTSSSDQT